MLRQLSQFSQSIFQRISVGTSILEIHSQVLQVQHSHLEAAAENLAPDFLLLLLSAAKLLKEAAKILLDFLLQILDPNVLTGTPGATENLLLLTARANIWMF